ncbi:MAG: IS200/IS605 family transposase [Proteobacteria bacterium]|nr:IS200/IS605 family transposase [Pseudomonadota bacterium]
MDYKRLSHTTWDFKYHVVFIPKCRKKKIFGPLRRNLAEIIHVFAGRRESMIMEGHLHEDQINICIEIPPKYAVATVVGYLKGKNAIAIDRNFMGRKRNFTGENFWARGYIVSIFGLDEGVVRNYIKNQEKEDDRLKRLNMEWNPDVERDQPPPGGL